MPQAVRVRTSTGWEDLQKVGPPGPVGPAGTVYDSDQIGTIKAFAGTTIPTNWILCDGRSLSRASYPELADTLGVPAAQATFTIPDLRNRFIYGASAPGVGASGGAATHTLAMAEMPSHSHRADGAGGGGGQSGGSDRSLDHNHYHGYWILNPEGPNNFFAAGAGGDIHAEYWDQTAGSTGGTLDHLHAMNANGGGGAHNNLPPYILIAFIIKVTGPQINPGGALVGPAGTPGTVDAYCQCLANVATAVTLTAGTWTLVPIPAVGAAPAGLVITKSDGSTDDFTRNADGTVTVNKTGNYVVSADLCSATAMPDNSNLNTVICRKAGAQPALSDNVHSANQTTGSGANNYPANAMTVTLACVAGDRISLMAYCIGGTMALQVRSFSIVRTGSGPAGPPGPTGPSSPPPDSSLVSFKRPGTGGNSPNFTGATEAYGVSAGDLRQTITPSRNLWWEVEFVSIIGDQDQAWYRCDADWWLDLGAQTSDALGYTKSVKTIQMAHAGAGAWRTIRVVGLFKVEAGKSYVARPVLSPSAGTWNWYLHGDYTATMGKVVGYW